MPTKHNNPSPGLCFGEDTILCPFCDHGIDPHGVDPGGPCGVGDSFGTRCPCLMQPNGIAEYLLKKAREQSTGAES